MVAAHKLGDQNGYCGNEWFTGRQLAYQKRQQLQLRQLQQQAIQQHASSSKGKSKKPTTPTPPKKQCNHHLQDKEEFILTNSLLDFKRVLPFQKGHHHKPGHSQRHSLLSLVDRNRLDSCCFSLSKSFKSTTIRFVFFCLKRYTQEVCFRN